MCIILILSVIAVYVVIGIAFRTLYRRWNRKREGYSDVKPLMLRDIFKPGKVPSWKYTQDEPVIILWFPMLIVYTIYCVAILTPKRITKSIWENCTNDRRDRIKGFFRKIGEKELLK